MRSPRSAGRIIGLLLLVHLVTGLTAPYIMLRPLTTPLTFNPNNPANSFQVRLSVMLLFVGGALTVAIGIAGLPIFRQHSYSVAVWVLALAVANFSLPRGRGSQSKAPS